MTILPALLAFMAASSVSAPAATADEASVIAFADAFDRAQLSRDGAALETMIADDLVFIDGAGKQLGKKDFIAGWTAEGDHYDPIVLIDRRVVMLGPDAAIVNAETTLSGTSEGKRFSSHFRFADSFARIGGKWRAVHIQVTPIR